MKKVLLCMLGLMLVGMAGCQTKTKVTVTHKVKNDVSATVSPAAMAVSEAAVTTEETKAIPLTIKKMNVVAKEHSENVPAYCLDVYCDYAGQPIVTNDRSEEGKHAFYRKENGKWVNAGKESPIYKYFWNYNSRVNTFVSNLIQRKNGDYLFYDGTWIARITKKGKLVYRTDIGIALDDEKLKFYSFEYLGDDLAVVQTYSEIGGHHMDLVDLKKGERVRKLPDRLNLLGVRKDGKIYTYERYAMELVILDVESGEMEEHYSLDSLLDTAAGYEERDLDANELISSSGPTYQSWNGTLYASFVSGIYRLNEEKKQWELLVDGKKDDFKMKEARITDFTVCDKDTFYLMGYIGDDECPTHFYHYEVK